ncbi:TIGR02147 family protein [Chitinispirillales bacterium ANBcel5]|uniref:TIGR02147 family protein n=1 Tax=Cellulosispirillum alkaliphilum TaxID=3039283 RepID=UPI002A56776D|nr:TIGR02147 family protein [Chitinispirillales bacterium ANBcel5]
MPNIYDYTDYRLFLKEYYEEQKKNKPYFSYQYLADHCKFRSKSFIYKVIKGEKALTVESALKIGKFMKLKKQDLDYFEAIIHFTNAKSSSEKEYHFKKIQNMSFGTHSAIMRQNQYEYFNHWYNPVIRELVTILDWKNDYTLLANSITPPITVWDAKRSVKLLLDLEMIRIDESGNYYQADKSITTGNDVVHLAIHNYQRQTIARAVEAIDLFERDKREISTLTVSISENGAKQLKQEIARFRKQIVSLVSDDVEPDRIYQINLQAFPMHQPKKDTK